MRVFTGDITTPLTITKDDGVFFISVIPASGASVTILGNGVFQGVSSTPITLTAGQSWTKSVTLGDGAIDYLLITPTGTVNIEINVN